VHGGEDLLGLEITYILPSAREAHNFSPPPRTWLRHSDARIVTVGSFVLMHALPELGVRTPDNFEHLRPGLLVARWVEEVDWVDEDEASSLRFLFLVDGTLTELAPLWSTAMFLIEEIKD